MYLLSFKTLFREKKTETKQNTENIPFLTPIMCIRLLYINLTHNFFDPSFKIVNTF